MKTANIPDIVTLKGKLFTGTYRKRAGSRNDRNLYCWFNEEGSDNFPHASIDISHHHDDWQYFHVSYPVYKKSGGWSDEMERVSYSVHVEIDPERDTISVVSKTNTSRWKMPESGPGANGFADMDRKALEFAKEFYSAAFFQSR